MINVKFSNILPPYNWKNIEHIIIKHLALNTLYNPFLLFHNVACHRTSKDFDDWSTQKGCIYLVVHVINVSVYVNTFIIVGTIWHQKPKLYYKTWLWLANISFANYETRQTPHRYLYKQAPCRQMRRRVHHPAYDVRKRHTRRWWQRR